MSRVRLILLVTLVALLVWVYAEGESLRADTITVDVELVGGSDELFVMPEPGERWTGRVTVQLRGSTASLDRLRDRLGSPVKLTATAGELPREPGSHRVDLRDALRRDETFRGAGVSMEMVEPEAVEVRVQALDHREVVVQVEAPSVQLAGPAKSDPARVRVSIPAALAETLDEPVRARAVVGALRLEQGEGLVPGQGATVPGVPVTLEPSWLAGTPGLVVEPESVDVTLTISSGRSEYTIRSMPVRVVVPGVSSGRLAVEVPDDDQFLVDVTLAGPSPAIDRLRRGVREPPMAIVVLEADRLAAISEPVELQLAPRLTGLPAGVEVATELPLIRVRVRPVGDADRQANDLGASEE